MGADGARRLWYDGRHPGGFMCHTVFLIVLLAGCSSNTGPSPSSTLLYVAGANGNVAPIATIAGPTTGLSAPVFLSF